MIKLVTKFFSLFIDKSEITWQNLKKVDKKLLKGNSSILKEYKSSLPPLNDFQKQALIGLMLGDLNLKKTGLTYCIRFEYSFHSSEYVYHLQSLFKYYILQDPKKVERTISLFNKNSPQSKPSLKSYNTVTLRFHSISLNLFDFLVDLFIRDGKKTIPVNLIKDHLTPVGLAYWFLDDGGKLDYGSNEGKGIVFNTQGFSFEECEQMSLELKEKFGFNSWVGLNKNKPVIKISGADFEKFVALVRPFLIPSLLSKLPSPRKTTDTLN